MRRDDESEAGHWRERAEFAETELRKLNMEITTAAIERREQTHREDEEKRAAERHAAEEAAAEKQRTEAWFNYRLEQALAGGDAAFRPNGYRKPTPAE